LRTQLGLSALEEFDARWSIYNAAFSGCLSLISIGLASLGSDRLAGAAGWIYRVLMIPEFTIAGRLQGRQRKRLQEAAALEPA